MDAKTKGAWLVHHTHKLEQVSGVQEFTTIYADGKAAILLSAVSASDQTSLPMSRVEVLAKASNINTLLELPKLLELLQAPLNHCGVLKSRVRHPNREPPAPANGSTLRIENPPYPGRQPFGTTFEVTFPNRQHFPPIAHERPLILIVFLSSRFLFPSSFGSQKSSRDLGRRASARAACRCQKQPWTKMTLRSLRKAISGCPGKSFA